MVVQVSKQALEDDLYQANTLCDSFKNEAQQLRALLESKDNMIVTLERTVRYIPVSVNFVWVTFSEIFFLVYWHSGCVTSVWFGWLPAKFGPSDARAHARKSTQSILKFSVEKAGVGRLGRQEQRQHQK
jgi:hypothetical protein